MEITSDDTGFSDTQTTDSTTLHCVFDNLAPGTQYNFTVNAVIREFDRRGPPSKKLMLTTGNCIIRQIARDGSICKIIRAHKLSLLQNMHN